MKKMLIISGFCLIPIILLGMALPCVAVITDSGKTINTKIAFLYIFILAVSLSIVIYTGILMSGYASIIDRIDKKEQEVDAEQNRLRTLIRHYNDLITGKKNEK